MAELTPLERLQPSLLDRLTDVAPTETQERREDRVISPQQLRRCVGRDLAWLLNTTNLEASDDLTAWPEVQSSVVNFGIRDLTGGSIEGMDVSEIKRSIRTAIERFEPRINSDGLEIEIESRTAFQGDRSLVFHIRGEVWSDPVPVNLYLKTELDLETGLVSVKEER